MKHVFSKLLLVLALSPVALRAQVFPAVPAAPPANLQGQGLRDWLRTNWYDGKRTVLSYSAARAKMYNYADNYNNSVTCVYSGYNTPVPLDFNSSSTSSAANINCEHTIPQSWFTQAARMVSDMHHLYPTYIQWNSNRGNNPFIDIPDASTTIWMRNTTSQSTIPAANIDEYSEATSSVFEPREDHKGNVARTAFYFYTMHDTQPELIATGHQSITSLAPLATLYAWHLADPVDARERERNRRAAASQGNYNPYIEYPELVAQAYGLAPAGPTFSFAAGTGSIIEGNSGTTTYTFTVNLSPAATTATTVQVSLDAASSTATSGTDFTFVSPTTVTFPAGSTSQTVTLTVTGDTQPEADETVVLTLTNPSTGNSVGSASTHTLTITNEDGQPLTLSFASASGTIQEGNTGTRTYTVNVTLSGGPVPPTMVAQINVDAANSTANSPSDYTLNTTSVSFFSGGPMTQPVTVTVNGDATYEPSETVRLVFGPVAPVPVVFGPPSTHVLTIVNDDAAPAGSPCTKPYFTQYAESATGNTKVVEIYNPTSAPMPLAGKRVVLYSNGATTATATLALAGIIAPGDVYVVANTGVTDPGVAAQTDVQNSVAFFNGDDAIALFDGTDTLDVIGVIGQQPTSWTVAGGGSTLNNTMVRLPNTTQGGRWNGPYGSATWTGNGVDNYAGVGSYTSAGCFVALASRAATVLRNTLEIYPNPASETVQVRLPGVATARTTTVQVLDMLGRPVRQRTAQLGGAETVAVDLRGLSAGIYAVRVQTAEAEYTGRVVVR
ncbi:hypothetical protein GCM10022409_20000 [Hymenobacter glaciei]|uniref:LTD domain-containing protein n=1 Tax=Hymenobacter glaciei TaxID=877209 RepID=A0ABP7U5V8_9BACT